MNKKRSARKKQARMIYYKIQVFYLRVARKNIGSLKRRTLMRKKVKMTQSSSEVKQRINSSIIISARQH